ncbi:MAG: aldo/keto reductase, partial [Clostridia bacterium]|nr:aldo/keto reductase [Clostridia bacterium]
GVFMITDLKQCEDSVLAALEMGYRHIDTAQVYLNESGVGEALSKTSVPRNEIFLTTKIWVNSFGYEKTTKQIDVALKKLKTDYIDLMLLHRPFGDYKGAWRALEDAVKCGKIRSIGLSNFNEKQTADILSICTIKPCINQIECHPFNQQVKWRKYLAENNIAVESWFPLGHGDKTMLQHPTFAAIANRLGKTPAQVILKWHLQSGLIVFPKATSPAHMQQNFDLFDFELTPEDMAEISKLDGTKKYDTTPEFIQKITAKFQRC